MPIYTQIVVWAWGAFILIWAVTALNVKRDASRMGMWRLWVFRVGIIIVVTALIADFHIGSAYGPGLARFATAPIAAVGAIGPALVVLGIGYAMWARFHLGTNWSPAPRIKEGHELVTSGPYKLVRHPIYTGVLLAALGSALVVPIWSIMFIVGLGIFLWRVKREEALMTQQFPDQYPEYKKRTWALIPFVY